jgi:hypothetical protein
VHSRCLAVEGDPIRGLRWKVVAGDLTRSVREGLKHLSDLPRVRVVTVREESGHPDGALESKGGVEGNGQGTAQVPHELATDLIAALVRLGWSRVEAGGRVEAAWARLLRAGNTPGGIRGETLLREAIRGAG